MIYFAAGDRVQKAFVGSKRATLEAKTQAGYAFVSRITDRLNTLLSFQMQCYFQRNAGLGGNFYVKNKRSKKNVPFRLWL
jgi:hypothetical protein